MKWLRKLLFASRKTHRRTGFNPSVSGLSAGVKRTRRRSQKTWWERLLMVVGPMARQALRLAPYGLIALATATLPIFGYKLYTEVMTSPHLALATVEIKGCEHLPKETILALSGLEPGVNLIHVDTDEIEERLSHLPWLRHVSVSRELPDRLVIVVEERKTAAILVAEKTYLVDSEGVVFKEMEPEDYAMDLLVIAGLDATRMMKSGEQRQLREALTEAMAIHRDYQSMGLERYYRVSEIHHDEVEGFSLVTSDRQRFVLGLEDYPEKLYRLADVLDHLQRNGSPVEVIRLDNEQQPWRVAAAGTRIEFKNRRVLPVISDAGRALLP